MADTGLVSILPLLVVCRLFSAIFCVAYTFPFCPLAGWFDDWWRLGFVSYGSRGTGKKIEHEGWSDWSLRPPPNYQSMIGISALFYALTGIHKPWVMLFYNSFLHASSGLMLLYFLYRLGNSKKISLIFSIAFVAFPTSLTWVSQIHKDGLYIFGMYATFLALSLAFSKALHHNLLAILLSFSSGFAFYLAGRKYALEIIFYFYAFFLLVTFSLVIWNLIKKYREEFIFSLRGFVVILTIFFYFNLTQTQTQTQTQMLWHWNPYVLDKIEHGFYAIAYWRNKVWSKYLAGNMGAIEEEVKFHSVSDFIAYTPRALFVGFFSPFPMFWFTEGSTTGGTIARYITPFEAVYLYIAWLFLPIAIWIHRRKPWVWFLLIMCVGFVCFHVVAEPNLGPILRKRYGYVMLLSALSYSMLLTEIGKRWKKHKVCYNG